MTRLSSVDNHNLGYSETQPQTNELAQQKPVEKETTADLFAKFFSKHLNAANDNKVLTDAVQAAANSKAAKIQIIAEISGNLIEGEKINEDSIMQFRFILNGQTLLAPVAEKIKG